MINPNDRIERKTDVSGPEAIESYGGHTMTLHHSNTFTHDGVWKAYTVYHERHDKLRMLIHILDGLTRYEIHRVNLDKLPLYIHDDILRGFHLTQGQKPSKRRSPYNMHEAGVSILPNIEG